MLLFLIAFWSVAMVRRFYLHVDMTEAQADTIKQAAHNAHLRPSAYVLDRVVLVAQSELRAALDERDVEPIEDIDDAGGGRAPDYEITPENVKEQLLKRRFARIILSGDSEPTP
jgi:hypothetical protein